MTNHDEPSEAYLAMINARGAETARRYRDADANAQRGKTNGGLLSAQQIQSGNVEGGEYRAEFDKDGRHLGYRKVPVPPKGEKTATGFTNGSVA